MASWLQTTNLTPREALTKYLHLAMILLCILATLALLGHPSPATKVILSIILISYALVVVANAETIKLIFQLDHSSDSQFKALRPWGQQTQTPKQKERKPDPILNNSSMKRNDNESVNVSLDRSSQDIKNMSISVYKSLSASSLSQSRLSRMKTSIRKQGVKGLNLMDIFSKKSKKIQGSRFCSEGSSIVLSDGQTYLRDKSQKQLNELSSKFEETLAKVGKSKRDIEIRYNDISNFINNLVKLYLNEHNFTVKKLKQQLEEAFQIEILEGEKILSFGLPVHRKEQKVRLSLQSIIFYLLLIKQSKIKPEELVLKFRGQYSWGSVLPKVQQNLGQLLTLSETLGVDQTLLQSTFASCTQEMVEDYFNKISMMSQFIDPSKSESPYAASKSRTYVLYLVIQHFNKSLKHSKISFEDNLNLRYGQAEKVDFLVKKVPGTEDPLLHFDLKVNSLNKTQHCEPGVKNYMSVVFFLLLELKMQKDLVSWSVDIRQLLNEIS